MNTDKAPVASGSPSWIQEAVFVWSLVRALLERVVAGFDPQENNI